MKNVSAEVSLFCLWTNWIHLVICSKIVFRELYYCSRCALNKICEIYTFAVHWSGLAKHTFWLGATQKKRIREQLNYFGNMCPKPFSWAKNKIKLFFFFRREVLSESGTKNYSFTTCLFAKTSDKYYKISYTAGNIWCKIGSAPYIIKIDWGKKSFPLTFRSPRCISSLEWWKRFGMR